MRWILLFFLGFTASVVGTPPRGGDENFYNYRMEYDDDQDYANGNQDEMKRGRGGNYYDEDEDDDGSYRSESWRSGNSRGWGESQSFSFNRIPAPRRPQHMSSMGWGEEEEQVPWSPPRRRKPSYVVKIRRPVKKDPAWIYFRPPNPGRQAPGWSRPRPEQQPSSPRPPVPARRPPPTKVMSTWEEDSRNHYAPKDASYSFAYDAGDSQRNEYADPWGTVRGSYSYIDPNGVRRTVHYTAGAATGFKILNTEPSSVVESVYRDPIVVRRKPSAFVYHLHPDGGWKPWEGRKESSRRGESSSRRTNDVDEAEEELSLDETRYDTQQQRKLDETQGTQERQSHRYENQLGSASGDLDSPRAHSSKVEVRGYEGGYGDRNPLLVMEDKKNSGISPGRMMAMRMRRRKPDQQQSSRSEKSQSESMKLMHQDRLRSSNH